jgi:photosynthetic reaction center cytochrome c subunit
MELGLKRTIGLGAGMAVMGLLGIASAGGQAAPPRVAQGSPEKVLMADEAFKNVQVLKGISVKEFMETMGFFAASLNLNCTGCHGDASAGSWDRYADELPLKQTARRMVLMMNAINRTYFAGKREVTCYSCHRNAERPKITPVLAEQYGTPPPLDPDEIPQQAAGAPTPDQLLDKYIQAVGGAQKVATLTSYVAKGSYLGYADNEMHPVDIYAKAPGLSAQIMHGIDGDSSWIYDGRSAWVAQPESDTPVTVVGLTAGDLDGANVEGSLAFPARIKQLLTKMRTGFPTEVDDKDVMVMEGVSAGGNNVKLYFDPKSGLLTRMVRFTNLPVGFIPTEIDYSDYRDVNGIKMPFHVVKTWVDGRSDVVLSSIQANVPIDAAKFAKPAAPVAPKTPAR